MIRLFIENNEADINEGFSHQITYAVDDLNNLDSKSTSFSKTIVLPGTAKNNYLLGNIFEFSNSNFTGDGENVGYNFNASKSAKCRLEINGLQIIKGVLRLMEIVRDGDSIEYEIAIFGELGGFVSKLGNSKIEDLDFSDYNHDYTIGNITDRWNEKADYIFISNDVDCSLTNWGSYSEAIIITNEDLTQIIEAGDTIKFENYNTSTDYGTYTIQSINFDRANNQVSIITTTAFSSPPMSTFKMKATVLNKGGYGVYYPLIDYGNFSTDKKDYRYKTFRPALFVREYIHKIITGAGYTYQSRFFESDFFKRLIIPHNENLLKTIKSDLFKGNINLITATTLVSSHGIFTNSLKNIKIYGDDFNTSDNITYQYNGTSTNVTFTIYFNVRIYTSYNATMKFELKFYKNNILQNVIYTIEEFNVAVANKYYTFTVVINTSLNTGDNIRIDSVTEISGSTFFYLSISGTNEIISQFPVVASVNLNDYLEVNRAIPKNILQKNFFASIIKMFYLMVTEDKYKEKHLVIEPWTWFFNLNKNSYIDWTMKLDRSQPIRIKPMSEANSRYYEIKYKGDSDYFNDFYKKKYNEGYGDVRYDNQLEFAKESESSEVIFASTPLIGYSGEDKVIPSIFKWDGKVAGVNEETVNSVIRIMQSKRIIDVAEWNILSMDETPSVIASDITRYPYAGHFDDPDAPASDLNFGATKELFYSLSAGALGNNLFNTFYSSYLAEITDKDSRLVTAKFKLNDTDIFNLDFGKFIYLDGVLYRLSKIIDYTPGEICTVELLRVIYTTYDNTVNNSDAPEVTINGLVWKSKNLDTEYYSNGDLIPQITDDTEWESATTGAWCYYENITSNGVEYGKLYNWYAVNDARGLAPTGYHVATQTDFDNLETFASNNGNELKESGTIHWNTDNGTDNYGFKALGAGRRRYTGPYDQLKDKTYFWTADEHDIDFAYYSAIQDSTSTIINYKIEKNYGFSIRLVKD